MAERDKFQDIDTLGQVCLESFNIVLVEGNKKMQLGISLRIQPASSLQEYEAEDPRKKERRPRFSFWVLSSLALTQGCLLKWAFVFFLAQLSFVCLFTAYIPGSVLPWSAAFLFHQQMMFHVQNSEVVHLCSFHLTRRYCVIENLSVSKSEICINFQYCPLTEAFLSVKMIRL